MALTIKTIPPKYFFSGDINLSAGQEKEVDILKLTKTQLLDIIEGQVTKVLIVSDMDAVHKKYQSLLQGGDPEGAEVLSKRVGKVEETLENLTVGEVASVTYWNSTEW